MADTQSELNLSRLPPVFILPTHLSTDDLHELEDALYHAGGRLSYRAGEARVFLGKILHKKRAQFDLRSRGVWTKEESVPILSAEPPNKRRKVQPSSHDGHDTHRQTSDNHEETRKRSSWNADGEFLPNLTSHVVVLKSEWLEDCIEKDEILPFDLYLVFSGRIIERPSGETENVQQQQQQQEKSSPIQDEVTYIKAIPESWNSVGYSAIATASSSNLKQDTTATKAAKLASSILERAKEDAASIPTSSSSAVAAHFPFHRRRFGQRQKPASFGRQDGSTTIGNMLQSVPKLHRSSTSELERSRGGDDDYSKPLPPPPEWMNQLHPRPMYSCLRSTPPLDTSPNQCFIKQLEKIKEARLLTLDEIGVRAYSTSIASLAAYPHRIRSPREITRLPGCNDKIASLWMEWHESVTLSEWGGSAHEDNDGDQSSEEAEKGQSGNTLRSKHNSNNTITGTSPPLSPASSTYHSAHAESQPIANTALNPSELATGTKKPTASALLQSYQVDSRQISNEVDNEDPDARLDPHRTIPIVLELDANTDLHHLRLFHNIWGVGPDTARKFYLTHGWRSIDDVIEFGWSTLTRVQQIGVKFYDEFQVGIPRREVEDITKVVLKHARMCKGLPGEGFAGNGDQAAAALHDGINTNDPRDFIAVIVGGYRRGKSESGDVDVILTHRDERMTKDLVVDVVRSLETEGYITHTLTLHTTTSDRDQQTLPYRTGGAHGGHGFDSLDKALCVWQDPYFATSATDNDEDDDKDNPKTVKNPNIHRRVDIIISSWRTIGCAVLGWSGGTTFQRDIRRWAKRDKGWKFDSSGIRDRGTGLIVDLERDDGRSVVGWEDRERMVMEGLGIGWREARERCTG